MAGDFTQGESEVEACAEIKARIDCLVKDLGSGRLELQRYASEQLRLLAKKNVFNRDFIYDAGAVLPLVNLLKEVNDSQVQTHAVTALLNLSLNQNLKVPLVGANVIEPLIEVLTNGNSEAKENAAATLFSLSSPALNKAKIGTSSAFLALVELLRDGSCRGRRDAASAIFSLAILPANRALAVSAGAVGTLAKLMLDENSKLHDEALSVLALLSTHQEGQVAIGRANILPMLVDLVVSGSARNKENAVSILLDVGKDDPEQVAAAVQLGLYGSLGELASTGTEKGRRRALRLIRLINTLQMGSDDYVSR